MAFSAKYNWRQGIGMLALGLAGMGGLLLYVGGVATPTLPAPSQGWWEGLFTTLFLTGLGIYLHRLSQQIEFFSPEELIGFGLVFGTAALGISLLPTALGSLVLPATVSLALGALQLTLTASFFMGGTLLLSRLARWKKRTWPQRLWQAFTIGLAINLIFNFEALSWNPVVRYGIIGLTALPAVGLWLQLDWITHLQAKGKKVALVLLSFLTLVTAGLLVQQYFFPLSDAFHLHLLHNGVLLLTGGFVFGFSLLSSLALLFYLPLSRSFENQQQALQSFGKMSQAVQAEANEQPILELLLNESLLGSEASAGWISLVDKSSPDDTCLNRKHISTADIKRIEYSLFCHPKHYGLEEAHSFVYLKDMQADTYMKYHLLNYRALLCFPLRVHGDKLYRMYVLHPMAHGFDQQETALLQSYIQQAQTALSNLFLLNDTIVHERYKEDLEIGKQVQQRLLPTHFPLDSTLDIAATSVAAEEVGGDYYDHFRIDDYKLALIMADVSGKGTTAAFHVAEMKGIFQSLVLTETGPAAFLKKANTAVGRCFDKGMFITLVYGVLDVKSNTFHYTRAGHCPVLVYKAKKRVIEHLVDDGLGLGILRDEGYDELVKEQQVTVEKGDTLIFYTDGITEARHPETKQEYGYERLRDCLLLHMDLPANKITTKIIQDIQQFTGQTLNRDDMSVMIVKC